MNKKDRIQPDFSNQFNADGSVFNDEEAIKMLMTGIVGSAMDAIISVDERQKVVLFNAAAEQMFLCPVDEALGSPLDRFIPERFRHSHRQHINRFDHSNVTNRRMGELGIIHGLRTDGEEFPIEASISQIEVEGKKFFTVILRDITRRKLAEQKLSEQAALLDIAQDAVIVRDLDDRILFWNKSAERIYGYSEAEAIGNIKSKLFYPNDSSDYEQAWQILLEQGDWTGELRQRTKDGREIIALCRWTLVRDENGEPQAVLSVNSDITEKKELEFKSLRTKRLESIGTLAGGIAHDLNNVLAPILMAIPALEKETNSEKSKHKLEIISRNAKLGAEIIQQLLSFARGGSEDRILFNPGERIREICRTLSNSFQKRIRIEISASENIWKIFGDATQFNQILMNLGGNARDAMPEGGTLRIAVENITVTESFARMRADARPGRYVMIIVEDTGRGIEPDIQTKIFEPFFTTKDIGEGTGLGLATVLQIVKSHDGFLDFESEPGRGTKFKIYLPAITSIEGITETETIELPIGHGELILVADDETTFREITRDTLESFNYRVLTAGNGSDVISLVSQHIGEIRAVFVDMTMPVLDGPATIEALQKIDPTIRVIATRGLSADERRTSVVGEIVKASLTKPYSAEKLLRTLAEVLR